MAQPPPDARDDTGRSQLDAPCSLGDPTRRRVYDYVGGQDEPIRRDKVGAALGMDRSTVVYHLDRLVDEGPLSASFARPEGRGGPGAGRPAKHYERSGLELSVSVPPRDNRLAAEVLARAADADATGTVRRALARAATNLGREIATGDAESTEDLFNAFAGWGSSPTTTARSSGCATAPSVSSRRNTDRADVQPQPAV